MKRLLAQTGITYFSVLAVAFYMSETVVRTALVVFAVILVLFFCVRKIRRTIYIPAMALSALLACTVNIGYSALAVQPVVDRYSGGIHEVTAILQDEAYKAYSKYYYRLETVSVDGEELHTGFLLKSPYSLDIEPDDTIRFTADIETVENNYYRAKGYFISSDSYDIVYDITDAESHSLYYGAIRLRKHLRRAVDFLLTDDCADLSKAVFIGDKYALDLSVRESFRFAGASYFIVVSGMHFSVVCMMIFRLMKRLRKRWLTFAVTILFILLYMAVTGFQPSVMRSGIMMIVMVSGTTIRRQTYPLNHLGIAGFILPVVFSPYGVGDIGLILSFYATMSILLWSEPISKKLCFTDEFGNIYRFSPGKKIDRFIHKEEYTPLHTGRRLLPKKLYNMFAQVLSVSLASNILVLPISVFVFGGFSTVTLLSSVILNIPVYLILVMSMFVCVLFWLGPLGYIALALRYPLMLICRYVLGVVGFLGGLPFSYVKVSAPWSYIWFGAALAAAVWVILPRDNYKRLPYAALFLSILLIALMLTHTFLDLNTLRLEVYDCSDGLCAAVNSGGRLHLLSVDLKSAELYDTLSNLSSKYGGAQTVVCSSLTQAEKLADYSSGEFAFSGYLLYDKKGREGEGYIPITDGGTYILDDGVIMYTALSNSCVVEYLEAGDMSVLIVPKGADLSDIPDGWESPDIMIIQDGFIQSGDVTCRELIICGSTAAASADVAKYKCDKVYYTGEGDICLDLR